MFSFRQNPKKKKSKTCKEQRGTKRRRNEKAK